MQLKKLHNQQIAVADATKNASVAYTKANVAAKLFSNIWPFFLICSKKQME